MKNLSSLWAPKKGEKLSDIIASMEEPQSQFVNKKTGIKMGTQARERLNGARRLAIGGKNDDPKKYAV